MRLDRQWQERGFAAAVLCRIGGAEGFAGQAELWLRHACPVFARGRRLQNLVSLRPLRPC